MTGPADLDEDIVLRWLESREDVYLDNLLELIRIDSTPGREPAAHDWLHDLFADRGIALDRVAALPDMTLASDFSDVEISLDRLVNLRGRLGEADSPAAGVLVSTHVDTVPAMPGQQARRNGDVIHGRGAADAKGNIMMLVASIDVLRRLGLPHRDITIDLVAQEEIGGNGALLSVLSEPPPDEVVVLEPTSLVPRHLTRGYLELEITVDSEERHAAESDATATAEIVRLINGLDELSDDLWRAYGRRAPASRPGATRLRTNVTRIHAESWRGSSPARCEIRIGVGYPPGCDWRGVLDRVTTIWGPVCARLPRSTMSTAGIHNDGHASPPGRLGAVLSSAARTAPDGAVWNASCDARTYAGAGAREVVVFGSGALETAHTATEHLDVAEWRRGVLALTKVLLS